MLKGTNPFYSDFVADNWWVDLTEHSDPTLWNLLNYDGTGVSNMENETDSDEEIEGNNYT